MHSLELPTEIANVEERREVLRLWIDRGQLSLSIAENFPDHDQQNQVDTWALLLSDVFRHVADAIELQTHLPKEIVASELEREWKAVVRSERDSRFGTIRPITSQRCELPDPVVSGDDNCKEVIRIILTCDATYVLVLVGMWLPDNEEATWANILYDLSQMIASNINDRDPQMMRDELTKRLADQIRNPSSDYSGRYYSSDSESERDNSGDTST